MDELCQLVAGVLRVKFETVKPETGPRNESHWDSFHHVHIVMAVEEKYGIELEPNEIASLLSVNDISALLKSRHIEGFD